MPADDLASLFTERLALAGVEYMVTGSTACIAYDVWSHAQKLFVRLTDELLDVDR